MLINYKTLNTILRTKDIQLILVSPKIYISFHSSLAYMYNTIFAIQNIRAETNIRNVTNEPFSKRTKFEYSFVLMNKHSHLIHNIMYHWPRQKYS